VTTVRKVREIDRGRVYDARTHEPHDERFVLIFTSNYAGWTRSFRGSWQWRKDQPTHWREMLEAP
jgi:hypothetical protein